MSRIEKINELIKQELGKVILENVNFNEGMIVTIMHVDTSKTIEHANVWISVFPENKSGEALKILMENIAVIQGILNKRISLRFVPKISFKIDKSQSFSQEIGKVFDEIKGVEDDEK